MEHKEQNLRNLLNKIAAEQGYEDYELIINEISSGGANYTSQLYTAIIREQNKNDLHLFAKVSIIPVELKKSTALNLFDTESFVYTKLLKTFEALEEENGVPEEYRLKFTKFFGYCSTENEEILVLDNLLVQGYSPYDRFQAIDWEYAVSVVADLARFHALAFGYSEIYPEEFGKVVTKLQYDWGAPDIYKMCEGSLKVALNVLEPRYKELLENFFKASDGKFLKFVPPSTFRPVIAHGDFRGSNMLHRVRPDGSVDIKIVDLQTLQGGSPVTDLLYFIFTGSDEKFRAEYYDKLIDHYYAELSAALKRLHLNPDEIYSRQHFDQELQEKLPFGLALAVFTLPVITVDTDKAPKVNESMEITDFSVSNTSALYKERLNGVINDYVRWGVLN